MTGAGSLSPSPQPVTKTPAELSLIGGPAHSIAAVISAAPLLMAYNGGLDATFVHGVFRRVKVTVSDRMCCYNSPRGSW
jgi:hypothetical protein